MGFYVANEHQAVAEEPRLRRRRNIPPSKNRVWDFFSTSHSRTGFSVSQPVGTHRETAPMPMKTASGVRYYGYRYYSPGMGRWLSRDPIGENGFHGPSETEMSANERIDIDVLLAEIRQKCPNKALQIEAALLKRHDRGDLAVPWMKDVNLYSFVGNRPTTRYDIFGLVCGPAGWQDWLIPDAPFGFDFEPCCLGHDQSYASCLPQGRSKAGSDNDFLTCMLNNVESQASWIKPGWLGRALAETYAAAVRNLGCDLFTAAQSSCTCPGKCDN